MQRSFANSLLDYFARVLIRQPQTPAEMLAEIDRLQRARVGTPSFAAPRFPTLDVVASCGGYDPSGTAVALSSSKWLERYRARILFHQPGLSVEVLDDYATLETYEVMSPDFPDDPELAVDIDPDLAYVERPRPKKAGKPLQTRRWPDDSQRED